MSKPAVPRKRDMTAKQKAALNEGRQRREDKDGNPLPRGPRRIGGTLLLGIPEAGELLGLTEKATRARIERGEIPARRFGGRVVVVRAELEAFILALPRVVSVEEAK